MILRVRLPSYFRRFQSHKPAPPSAPAPVDSEPIAAVFPSEPAEPPLIPQPVFSAPPPEKDGDGTLKLPTAVPHDFDLSAETDIIGDFMLEAFGKSDPGNVRTNNEDYYLLFRDRGLYLVADGMGGAQAGEHASKLAAETVAEYIWDHAADSGPEVLAQAFEEANRRVIDAASSDSTLEGMGTTLVAVLVRGSDLLISSVGDSRAYVYEDGHLLVITEDQTWVHEVGRKLGLDEVSLRSHPMRHVLTMAIGVSSELRIHSYVLKPQPGTQILLCSDGLHGVVDAQMIADTLAQSIPLEQKCMTLIHAAKESGGPDNITAVLLQATEKPGGSSTPDQNPG